MHVSNRTYFEAARFIKSKETSIDLEDEIVKRLDPKPDYIQYDQVLIKRLNQQALESPRAMRYYSGRLITEESVKKFALGYSEKQDMVTIPVHSPDGMEVGFVGRSVDGKQFKNTPGLPKSKLLFNLHRVKAENSVYIVESSFDAIRLDQCGLPAVATLGAYISSFQIDLLKKYFNSVFVISDNDEAGNTMADRIIEKMGSKATVIKLDSKYKDIGDMSDEEIMKISVSFDSSIQAILNGANK